MLRKLSMIEMKLHVMNALLVFFADFLEKLDKLWISHGRRLWRRFSIKNIVAFYSYDKVVYWSWTRRTPLKLSMCTDFRNHRDRSQFSVGSLVTTLSIVELNFIFIENLPCCPIWSKEFWLRCSWQQFFSKHQSVANHNGQSLARGPSQMSGLGYFFPRSQQHAEAWEGAIII